MEVTGTCGSVTNSATLMRVLAVAAISVAVLSLALWAAVWLAIRLL